MVTISNGSVVFTFNDGDVESIDTDVTSEIDAMPSPASTSEDTFLSDINGVMKKITVKGAITEATSTRVPTSTVLTIAAQIAWLEANLSGNQNSRAFTSGLHSLDVMVEKFSYTELAGEPSHVPFSINLVVGTG